MLNTKKNTAFTLIEVIISVAIFSIIMVSIMSIFIISSDTTLKADINRAMHENVKNSISEITEDIRKNWIIWVSLDPTRSNCTFTNDEFYKEWTKLCTWNNEYYLAYNAWTDINRADADICKELNKHCFLYKHGVGPLTNSLVDVKDLTFYVSKNKKEWSSIGTVKKATINITFQPSIKSWVKPDLIKNNKLYFQTTVSERPF